MKPRYKERIQLKVPVLFTGSHTGEGRVLDLTIPGCLIESPVKVEKGRSLQLKLFLPGLRSPFTVTLAVVRWTKGTQFGAEFIKMDEAQRLILNHFMAQYLSDPAPVKATGNRFSEPGGRNWHLETYSISKKR
jgi:PilZ domain